MVKLAQTRGESRLQEISDQMMMKLIPPRSKFSKKGENGVVVVVGGNWLYHGAPTLSALAALKSGVDLVYRAENAP